VFPQVPDRGVLASVTVRVRTWEVEPWLWPTVSWGGYQQLTDRKVRASDRNALSLIWALRLLYIPLEQFSELL
jgi:hypothetical protein